MRELIGLIQLASCDLTRRLLPETLIYAVSAAVMVSDIVIVCVVASVGRRRVLHGAMCDEPREPAVDRLRLGPPD
jgi:hypothetical protein